jgi:hypothetical protein
MQEWKEHVTTDAMARLFSDLYYYYYYYYYYY